MSWLDGFFFGVKQILGQGVAVTQRLSVNFAGAGVVVSDNAAQGRTDVTISGELSGTVYTDQSVILTTTSTTVVGMKGLTAARSVTPPASPAQWQRVYVIDCDGSLATWGITFFGNTHNVKAATQYVMTSAQDGAYAVREFIFNGTLWNVR